jgi:hypothetical protein
MKGMQLLKIAFGVGILFLIIYLVQSYKDASTVSEAFAGYQPRTLEWSTIPPKNASTVDVALESPALTPQPSGSVDVKTPTGWLGAPPSVSTDLLPRPEAKASEFGQFAPKNPLAEQNFIDAAKLVGADTVGSTLKNANYGLRKDPPLSKSDVGPWLNSTIEADVLRKSLDC